MQKEVKEVKELKAKGFAVVSVKFNCIRLKSRTQTAIIGNVNSRIVVDIYNI